MITASIYPLIELVMYKSIQTWQMMRDQQKWCPCRLEEFPKQTKCTTASQYYDLYVGPEYKLHYKLASIQTIVATTFMFGAGMPILFVIGAFAFVILFTVEKYTIAKVCR